MALIRFWFREGSTVWLRVLVQGGVEGGQLRLGSRVMI